MTVTVAGSAIDQSRIEVATLPQTAWAWITAPLSAAVEVGAPVEITTRDGAPVLSGAVAKVQLSRRHQRIIARPAVLADMTRRTVEPETLTDVRPPDALAVALGPHTVTVLPPVDTVPMPLWSTRTRSQSWALESVLHALRHDSQAVAWRYDARADAVIVFEPGGDEQRTELTVADPLLSRGGAVEVSAVSYAIQSGDLLDGALVVRAVRTTWMKEMKRSLVYLS